MDNVKEAKELIRSIRRAKHVNDQDGKGDNAHDLEEALTL
jgi:hypothetical protein